MAFGGSHPYCSSCWNFLLHDLVEDELAKNPGLVGGPLLSSISPTLSCNPILGPDLFLALIFALVPAPVPAPTLTQAATNDLFKQFMKAYLESNQRSRQPPTERKQPLKAKIPELYYGKLHMDYYQFCQQCKDYFETARATKAKRTLFAAFFLHGNISMRST